MNETKTVLFRLTSAFFEDVLFLLNFEVYFQAMEWHNAEKKIKSPEQSKTVLLQENAPDSKPSPPAQFEGKATLYINLLVHYLEA